jgi:hypothetical protein
MVVVRRFAVRALGTAGINKLLTITARTPPALAAGGGTDARHPECVQFAALAKPKAARGRPILPP